MEKKLMKTIKEITKKLFSVSYENDLNDDKISAAYENMATELIKNNKWLDVYACWYDYLVNSCNGEEDVLNFANLFWCYEGYKQFIPNALEFCAFFYACVSFDHHPEAISVIDGITWYALMNSGIISQSELSFEDFAPANITTLTEAINKWKKKGYGLH